MSQAIERLVNLALFLAASKDHVSARTLQERVEGYPSDQDEATFLRMFERDKKALREHGLVIEAHETPDGTVYSLDAQATFATPIEISTEQAAQLRTVGAALLADEGFPHRDALRSALFKLAVPVVGPVGASSAASIVRSDPRSEGEAAAILARAAVTRKRAAFGYETADGRVDSRMVEPYGLFLRDARWYLVARDVDREAVRVFAARRMSDARIETAKPGTPDFATPEDIDVASYARLPFQYGDETFEAELRFESDIAWRAPVLTEGRGEIETHDDGSLVWRVTAADADELARWTVLNGPGLRLVAPQDAVLALRTGLSRVVEAHG